MVFWAGVDIEFVIGRGLPRYIAASMEGRHPMKQFKELLFELSAKLISIPPDQISSEIETGLRLIGEFWKFDRITLAEFVEHQKDINITSAYHATGIPKVPLRKIDEDIPWIIGNLSHGKTVLTRKLPDDLPGDAEVDRDYCRREGLKSAFAVPLKIGPTILGGCFFSTINHHCAFKTEMVEELRYLVEILASALERERAAKRIHAMLQFELLLSDVSATYINMPKDMLDSVIRNDLGRLGRLLGVNRCLFYALEPGEKRFSFPSAHAWWPEEDNKIIVEIDKWRNADPYFWDKFQFYFDKWLQGEIVQFERLEELPEEAAPLTRIYEKFGTKSGISIPVSVGGTILGALVISTTRNHRSWPKDLVPRLRLIGEVFANALMRKKNEESIDNALTEITQLKAQLETDYRYLTDEFNKAVGGEIIVGTSPGMKRVIEQIMQVAPTQTPVLLLGETGSGKNMLAMALHRASRQGSRPLVQLNCATLAPGLVESELFGHERGAFTGADRQRAGRFEIADKTTLFLDEIGEISQGLQAKLLRVLETGEFERLGGSKTIKTGARIIAASNRDLEQEAAAGRFRMDLWYRLNIFPIYIPPLRERTEDIPVIVEGIVERFSKLSGKRFASISPGVMDALKQYPWPGNVRELRNLIERAVIVSPGQELCITVPQPPADVECPAPPGAVQPFAEMERSYLLHALGQAGWRIEGSGGAADLLGLNPSTLRSRMRKLGIQRAASKFE